MDEEARAADYRAQEARRRQWERDNALRMKGDASAADAVRAGWQPVLDAARESRQTEPDPVERHDRTVWSPA